MPGRYAGLPEEALEEDRIAGTYEVITLKYQYKTMQQSRMLYLNENGSASGALSGNWSYNAATKTLTIGSQKLIIKKGWDWEDTPRHTTPIFSGINDAGESIWGKKVD